MSETAEMQSAGFALMYDDEALYIGADVRDPNPMMNRHDPWVDANKSWDADACQFRLVVDPSAGYPVKESAFNYRGENRKNDKRDEIIHSTLWYYTDRKEANLQLHRGMGYRLLREEWGPHGAVPHKEFEAKYLPSGDGRGYTFEYRIPWAILGAKSPPKGGNAVAGTVQFNWSRADGLKTAGGSAWCYDVMAGPGFPYQSSACWGKIVFSEKGDLPRDMVEEGVPPERPLPLTFKFDMPEDGEVSIGLFDKRRMCVRNLIAQGERRRGHVIEKWDGLDANGKPLLPGEYAWKGLYHKGLQTEFKLSVHNSGNPPYKNDESQRGYRAEFRRVRRSPESYHCRERQSVRMGYEKPRERTVHEGWRCFQAHRVCHRRQPRKPFYQGCSIPRVRGPGEVPQRRVHLAGRQRRPGHPGGRGSFISARTQGRAYNELAG